jgi:uncharacterized protein (DUF1330 family)
MLNLLKFKGKAEYADGRDTPMSGAEAYGIYSKEVQAYIKKVDGKVIFFGDISRLMLSEVEDLWDQMGIVMYPSRKEMMAMIKNSDYQESAKHREAGLDGQLNIEVKNNRADNTLA